MDEDRIAFIAIHLRLSGAQKLNYKDPEDKYRIGMGPLTPVTVS